MSDDYDLIAHIRETFRYVSNLSEGGYSEPVIIVASPSKFVEAKARGLSDLDAAFEAGILEYKAAAPILGGNSKG